VAGNLVSTVNVVVNETSGIGTAEFTNIVMTNNTTGYEVKAEATNLQQASGEVTKIAKVDIGSCGIVLLPTNTSCLLADVDPTTPGFQVDFIVSNPERTCTTARIKVTSDGNSIFSDPSSLASTGSTKIRVTLLDHTDGVDGVTVQVSAEVSDTASPSRAASTADLPFVLDLVDPVLTIDQPSKAVLTLKDDNDADPSNGLTFNTSGTVTGAKAGEPVEVSFRSEVAGTPQPDAISGQWQVNDLGITIDGVYKLVAKASDSCGRIGTVEREFTALVTTATIVLVSPMAGEVLLAKNDGNPSTPMIYETTAVIVNEGLTSGTTMTVRCREGRFGTPFVNVGSLLVDTPSVDGQYTVPISLSVQTRNTSLICQVIDDAANPSRSSEVAFTVGLPAPVMDILRPAEGSFVNSTSIPVVLSTSSLNDVVPTIGILDQGGLEVLLFTPASPIRNDGLVFTLPLLVGGQPLPDGVWTLYTDAVDVFGNLASDNPASVTRTTFTLDTAAPEVVITSPGTGTLDPAGGNPLEADQDATAPGYQTTIEVTVLSGGGPGTIVCLTVNGDRSCQTMAPDASVATFPGVTLIPGNNEVSAQATDTGGNVGATVARTIQLILSGPRVRIITPAQNGPIAVLPFDLAISVTDVADVAQADLPVTLTVDGTTQYPLTTDSNGIATISIDVLTTTPQSFVASATVGGNEGFSAPRVLRFKDSLPVLTFRVPASDQSISLLTTACLPGSLDCIIDVLVDGQNLEKDSTGQLTVTCGTSTIVYNGSADATGVLKFDNVLLSDQSSCTLDAAATDLAGQSASAQPITVSVDRIAPVIASFQQPDPTIDSLTYSFDESPDPAVPGLQFTFKVIVSGLELGSVVTVVYETAGREPGQVQTTLTMAVPDGTAQLITLPQATLLDGTYTLTARTADSAGNQGSLTRLVDVIVSRPVVRLVSPTFVNRVACSSVLPCAASAVCADGFCATPWGIETARNVMVAVSALPPGIDNLRICSNRPGLSGPLCSTQGYRQVALVSNYGSTSTSVVVNGLLDGSHTLVAEGRLAQGQPWPSSADSPVAEEQFRYIFQDTVAPVVSELSCPSDILPPTGVLNIAEQLAADRVFSMKIVASEPGELTLVVNGLDASTLTTFTGDALVNTTLYEGENQVYAKVRDLVGNYSALPQSESVVYYNATVDTLAPTLSIADPAGAFVRAGDLLDVVVHSDAIGRTVVLLDGGIEKWTAIVDAEMTAKFPFTSMPILTDGNHSLEVTVSDEAGNPASATRAVTVDTIVPNVVLDKPVSGLVLDDSDDAQPLVPGFQIEVSLGTDSLDGSGWQIQLALNCDATFTTCDPPTRIAQGAITNAGGLEPSVFPTLPVTATSYFKVIAVVADSAGNQGSASANLTLNLVNCQVGVAGIGSGQYVNNQHCPTPGTNCPTASISVTVNVSAACAAATTARLTKTIGGTIVATEDKPIVDWVATFTVTVDNGTTPSFEAQAIDGSTPAGSSGALTRIVDLQDPVVSFTAPASGSANKWGVTADKVPGTPGLQRTLTVQATDINLMGGTMDALVMGAQSIPTSNLSLPYALSVSPTTLDLDATLPDQSNDTVSISVTDAAGNIATSSFTAQVDLQPPASPTLETLAPADLNRRRPAVTLRWAAVADNGTTGVPATSYDIRYSPLPITSDAEFARACSVAGLAYTAAVPVPAAPGSAESITITGPDVRNPNVTENGTPCKFIPGTNDNETNYAFAVRAIDAVGNVSPLVASSFMDVDVALRYANISGSVAPFNDPLMNKRVAWVGDIDGDGRGDIALGGGGTGTMANTFCIVYGNSSGQDKTIPPLIISAATGPSHQCLSGATGSNFGIPVERGGDLNHDGVEDLLVGEGTTPNQTMKVWFGVAGGRLAALPNLTFTGIQSSLAAVSTAGGGDFNGDGVGDLLVGSQANSIVYMVPGNSSWTAATNLAINLSDADVRTAHGIVPLMMTDGDASTRFGTRVAFVGDIDGDGMDEAAVSTYAVPSQVLVIKGRALTGLTDISVAVTSGGRDNLTVIRLAPDAPNAALNFGATSIAGRYDFDGDNSPEIVVTHSAATPFVFPQNKTIFIFRGGYLKTQFGQTVQINATPVVGTDILGNERGLVIAGSFERAIPIGNFDDDPNGPSVDLVHVMAASAVNGKVHIRRNLKDPAGSFDYGTLPYGSPALVDPIDQTGLKFGYFGAYPIGDFNDDGFPDLLVGTNGSGYATILY
jgi:hypothetical protein